MVKNMGEFDEIRKPTSGKRWFLVGAILVVLALLLFVLLAIQLATGLPAEDTPPLGGALQGFTVVGAGVLLGAGLLVLTMGWIKNRRSSD